MEERVVEEKKKRGMRAAFYSGVARMHSVALAEGSMIGSVGS
jgi:hypothetical protein